MFRNYLKIAIRNLLKHRTNYIFNVLGLGIGLACVMLIAIWVQDEMSFDRFHDHSDHIYRAILSINARSDQPVELALTPPPLATEIKRKFPEVKNACRFLFSPQVVFKYQDKLFFEPKGALVDPSFLQIFSFRFKKGNPVTALNDPFNVVLTEQLAHKYFGLNDPLGQVIHIDEKPFQVTGVIQNVPHNSHIQFDFLQSILLKETPGSRLDDWGNVNLNTYVQLENNVNVENFSMKLSDWQTPRHNDGFWLQPLTQIHHTGNIEADDAVVSDKKYVYIFSFVAMCILFIACMNFINLCTVQSIYRTKEVGIRKVFGSSRIHLGKQFFTETLLMTFIAFIIAFILAELFNSQFNQLIGRQLHIDLFNMNAALTMIIIFGLTAILAGLYPALHFSSLNPIHLFRKMGKSGSMKSRLRKSMVVIQFSLSILLISCTFIVNHQLDFMKTMNKHYGDENIIYLPYKGSLGIHYETFKNQCLSEPSILQVTAKNSIPTRVANKTNEIQWPGSSPTQNFAIEATAVDYDYFNTMGIKILEGRSFDKTFGSDRGLTAVLNKAAIQKMGLEDAVGKPVSLWGYEGTIIGIAENAHFRSLKSKISPQIFYKIPDYNSQEMNEYGVVLMCVATDNFQATITAIKNIWQRINPDTPFEFHFLDNAIDRLYWNEMQLNQIIQYATYLAIFISCLGLYGLTLFSIEQKTKEIGIRKLLGSSVSEIVALLTKDFTKWVILANFFAWPIAYYAMNKWLQNFAYRIDLTIWSFLSYLFHFERS